MGYFYSHGVGTPVAGRPLHRPGRAVFPHPVPRSCSPRSYSHSRRTSLIVNNSLPSCIKYPGSSYTQSLQRLEIRCPVETVLLPSTTIEPLICTLYRFVEKASQRSLVALDAKVIVVPIQPAIQRHYKLPSSQMPIGLPHSLMWAIA